jgi:hypothetical protein
VFAVRLVEEKIMSQPVEGEPSEGFKKFIGASVMAVGIFAMMLVLNETTDLGLNPLNYAYALHQATSY